jgi:thiosulfate/3-mercaptopyruvate sulfurtransferase
MLNMSELWGKRVRGLSKHFIILWGAALMCLAGNVKAFPASNPWTAKQVVDPATLARKLKAPGRKPLLLHVGFRSLYNQGHIPGSKFCGPASRPGGIAQLKECVAEVPHTKEILLYCGCCPWEDCPNIRPAFEALDRMGFKRVRVLYIPHNYGRDWAQKGYPTER